MWLAGWRDRVWAELDRPWDLAIIGGGITGAGIFREAALAGLRCLLLEAHDFASGTSSRSSKMVHGGLRYLRNGQLRITYTSVRERERLLAEGPGLVHRLPLVHLHYARDQQPPWLFGLGLAVYDLMGRRWDHRRFPEAAVHNLQPNLNAAGLLGAHHYADAKADDARLVLRLIREGVGHGGTALNYAPVERLLKRAGGLVSGVAVRDAAPGAQGRTCELTARVVVNATGFEADRLRRQVSDRQRLRRLRGSHLVFSARRLPLNTAVGLFHPTDGRPMIILPWEGVTVVGNTDVEHRQTPENEPAISPGELDYLMEAVTYAFPGLGLDEAGIQATFSGVRGVVDTGKADPSKESREHAIWDEAGLLTVAGGKLTTFRTTALEALQAVRRRLPGWERPRQPRALDEPAEMAGLADLPPALRLRLAGHYGKEAAGLVSAAHPGELEPLDKSGRIAVCPAELRWSARAEGVVHLDDLLLRRSRLGLLLPEGGARRLEQIRAIVQPELGWDDERWCAERQSYLGRWQSAYSLPEGR